MNTILVTRKEAGSINFYQKNSGNVWSIPVGQKVQDLGKKNNELRLVNWDGMEGYINCKFVREEIK
jgi:hypothetical protein